MADQEYCLKWNNHQSTLTGIFDKLLQGNRYTDCTISAGGKNLAAHKILLTACSPYFDSVFSGIREDHHAVIVLSDVTYAELRALMDYMYRGEVNISQDRLSDLLKVAEALQIRGLYEPGESLTRAPPAPVLPPVVPSNRPSGLTIEKSRQSFATPKMNFPQEASRAKTTRSPVPKRRKCASGDAAARPDIVPVDSIIADDFLSDLPKLEPAFAAIRPKEEILENNNITLDDDEDDNTDEDNGIDMEQSQPGTSQIGEGSSQGYPPSWHNDQSNDETFMAAQQAVGDGIEAEGTLVGR